LSDMVKLGDFILESCSNKLWRIDPEQFVE
jgi:hypothetical protein